MQLHQGSGMRCTKTNWRAPSKTGEKRECWVFKPLLIEGTVFKEGENMTVYVSKDEKKIPIYIETDLVVGKAKVFLIDQN